MSAGLVLTPTAPLHSAQWFRVAQSRPRLDATALVRRQRVRGQRWHVLQRADGLRSVRMNAAAWSLVGRCDGQTPLQRLWEWTLREAGDAAPTQDEVLDLLTRLQSAGLLSVDRPAGGDPPALDAAGRVPAAAVPGRQQSWLAWRVPLGCPDVPLGRLAQVVSPLFAWPSRAALALICLWALLNVAWYGPSLLAQAGALVASPRGVWLAAFVYPVMKAVHEAAHGVMARRHGARVPQWGIAFLMLVPVPYVDASAASALPRAAQRAAVAAAGIVVEALAALVGVLLATQLQPGWVQDVGLMLMTVGALSTLALNANPLLRFDGYHLMCDLAGLPNLADRSRQWWLQRLQRRLWGSAPQQDLGAAPGEAVWLWGYAPAALVMRWLVSAGLVWWLADLSVGLALAVAAGLSWGLVVQPLRQGWRAWSRTALPAPMQRHARLRLALVGLLPVLVLGVLPWPDRTVAQGVWWLPESALVRTGIDGFVAEVLAEDGQAVRAGDVLIRLDTQTAAAEAAQWQARVAALQTEHWRALQEDPPRAAQLAIEWAAARAEAARAQERLDDGLLRAQVSGRLVLPGADDLPGRWLPRGQLVAHVVTGEPGMVKVAIPHERAALLDGASRTVELRRATSEGQPAISARWSGQLSGATDRLPSSALGDRSGGALPVDLRDEAGTRALHRVVLADIVPPAEPANASAAPGATATANASAPHRIGERVWVRFDHGHAPLAWQALRAVQQLVLRHLKAGT